MLVKDTKILRRLEKILVLNSLICLWHFSAELYYHFQTVVDSYHFKDDCYPPTWTYFLYIRMNLVDYISEKWGVRIPDSPVASQLRETVSREIYFGGKKSV